MRQKGSVDEREEGREERGEEGGSSAKESAQSSAVQARDSPPAGRYRHQRLGRPPKSG